jgi:hypothetical protein
MADKFEWNGDEPETKYDPSSVEVDRARQQGLGMGARDLARQRDPGEDEPPVTPQTDDEAPDAAAEDTR